MLQVNRVLAGMEPEQAPVSHQLIGRRCKKSGNIVCRGGRLCQRQRRRRRRSRGKGAGSAARPDCRSIRRVQSHKQFGEFRGEAAAKQVGSCMLVRTSIRRRVGPLIGAQSGLSWSPLAQVGGFSALNPLLSSQRAEVKQPA